MQTPKIEDHAFLSDTQTSALISNEGCVDWLCFPRFDSGACFAALLGSRENGLWRLWPKAKTNTVRRQYRDDTLILETEIETDEGAVRLVDFMPPRDENPDIIRIVEGIRGAVTMEMELIIRFDYGHIVPWVRKRRAGLEAIAGPDALILRTPVKTRGKDLTTVAHFVVKKGERVPFVLTWFVSHRDPPAQMSADKALHDTEKFWTKWAKRCHRSTRWDTAVSRSLVVLKGLTYAPTGGIVAAATASLPEEIGGVRNWDYRYCWLRDATFTLLSFMHLGYIEEARSWRQWLLRAIAGSAAQMQIMYGVRGERRLEEYELPWLAGYERSKPVRIGNAASEQFQLDVYGEVLDAMWQADLAGLKMTAPEWQLVIELLRFLESHWHEPDDGIWETRGGRKHFTHSKMMAWVAFDRAIKLVEECGCGARENAGAWRRVRDQIHAEVCARGYSRERKAFTQSYGSNALDASLLMMPMVGFLPPEDERVRNTIDAIQRDLTRGGFVLRYQINKKNGDGLAGSEGVFLPCSFWLAICLHLIGREEEARQLFQRLLELRNDLGLLSEEYDPERKRQLGNVPQAFTHVSLVNSALVLSGKASLLRGLQARRKSSRKYGRDP
jgi:GH15 family glucan-1,4-alpha-glucosidase